MGHVDRRLDQPCVLGTAGVSMKQRSRSRGQGHVCPVSVAWTALLVGLAWTAVEGAGEQRFAIEPVDKTALENDTILLACRVVNKVGRIQWTRDSFGLGTERELVGYPRYTMTGSDEEGDFSLQIRGVRLEDDARFQCQVGAADGVRGIRSRDAVLTVHVPPAPPVVAEGEALSTAAGTEVSVTCEAAAGKPAAELSWSDEAGAAAPADQLRAWTAPLADGKRATSFLRWTFRAEAAHDGRALTCRSEQPALARPQVARVRLAVRFAPQVALRQQRSHVLEGEDVRLECEARANPAPVAVVWLRGEEVLAGDAEPQVTGNSAKASLTLRAVPRAAHGQTLACEVRNAQGVGRAQRTLALHFGPLLRAPLAAVHAAAAGQPLRLRCDVAANPAPDVAWFFEQQPRVLATTADLLIPSVSPASAGRYHCRASVPGFPEVAASTLVLVRGPPRVQAPPVQHAAEGRAAVVACVVAADPPPTRVSWTRPARAPTAAEERRSALAGEALVRHELLLPSVRPDDFGFYNCSAENEFGADFLLIALVPQKSFPVLLVAAALVVTLLLLASAAVAAVLCVRRRAPGAADSLSDLKPDAGAQLQQQQSLAEPDLKADAARAVSAALSERTTDWPDGPAQVVDNIYNYSQQQHWYSASNNKINNASPANNNGSVGYVPYVDYEREFLPPSSSHPSHEYLLQQQHHADMRASPMHAPVLATDRDPYAELYGTALLDPRYGRAVLTSSAFLHSPATAAAFMSSVPVSAAVGSVISGSSGGSHSPAHVSQQHQQQQHSPLSVAYASSSNQMYITTSGSGQPVKQTPLATHV